MTLLLWLWEKLYYDDIDILSRRNISQKVSNKQQNQKTLRTRLGPVISDVMSCSRLICVCFSTHRNLLVSLSTDIWYKLWWHFIHHSLMHRGPHFQSYCETITGWICKKCYTNIGGGKSGSIWVISNNSISRRHQSHIKIAAETQLCTPPNPDTPPPVKLTSYPLKKRRQRSELLLCLKFSCQKYKT